VFDRVHANTASDHEIDVLRCTNQIILWDEIAQIRSTLGPITNVAVNGLKPPKNCPCLLHQKTQARRRLAEPSQ